MSCQEFSNRFVENLTRVYLIRVYSVGAINGAHVKILCPPNKHMEYINYKKFYFINSQALVDDRGGFLNVLVGYPG